MQPGWTPEIASQQPILEGLAGKPSREVGVYNLAMRPLMDGIITEKSGACVLEQAGSSRPFFLHVPFSLPHTPPLPSPRLADRDRTDYQNALREIDANTGAILDALDSADLVDNTIVVWASDNGPETLQGIGVQYGAQGVTNGYVMELNYPFIFNLENDPKELWNISGTSEWLGPPMTRIQTRYYRSIVRFPNLKPGQVEPGNAG